METSEFDKKFQELCSKMVEIAFEFVKRNQTAIDAVYVYGSVENKEFFYNNFYCVNGQTVKKHKVNTVSSQQYNISSEQQFALLKLGNRYLEETAHLFVADGREVPTLMKMTYNPKTGHYNNDISYELQYSNDADRTDVEGFEEWFNEMKKSDS